MKCARCNTSLDDGAMVCSQCGAVVGMSYDHAGGPSHASFPSSKVVAPRITPPKLGAPGFPPPLAGSTKRVPQRVKAILVSPRDEWRAIAGEPASAADIWLGYVIPLALIGPAALAIAHVVVGTAFPFVGLVKATLVTGVAVALLTFAFALVQVAVLAWGVNAMAPKFRANPDRLAALKVVAYSMTPVWLVGILYLLPALGFLWVFAALYAFFLAFLGLQALMRCTSQQALAYTFATLGIAFALWVSTGTLVTALMGFGPVMLE